jgi:pseudouridine-5'-phosphate glycosidase
LPPPFFYVNSSVVDINPEIYDALMKRRPVVALESTIITHGMPHPHNIETAIEVEKIVQEQVIEFRFSLDDKLPPAMS